MIEHMFVSVPVRQSTITSPAHKQCYPASTLIEQLHSCFNCSVLPPHAASHREIMLMVQSFALWIESLQALAPGYQSKYVSALGLSNELDQSDASVSIMLVWLIRPKWDLSPNLALRKPQVTSYENYLWLKMFGQHILVNVRKIKPENAWK